MVYDQEKRHLSCLQLYTKLCLVSKRFAYIYLVRKKVTTYLSNRPGAFFVKSIAIPNIVLVANRSFDPFRSL